jgi:outer membrane protein assembly factor BamA
MTRPDKSILSYLSLLRYGVVFFVIYSSLSACRTTKHVPNGDLLLIQNDIILPAKSKNDSTNQSFTIDELNTILKQQPNRKTFGIPFYLHIYNLSNQKRIDKRILKKEQKAVKKNTKITLKNNKKLQKKPTYEVKDSVSRKKTLGEKLREIGEAPVLLDSNDIAKSVSQLSIFLLNRGYFNNTVRDTLILPKKYAKDSSAVPRKYRKARVNYIIELGKPSVVYYYDHDVKDSAIRAILAKRKDIKIEIGANFNTDQLDEERIKVTQLLQENGYYFFNREFIFFKIDSSCQFKRLDVTLSIQNFKYKDIGKDTLLERPHIQYTLNNPKYYLGLTPRDTTQKLYAVRYYTAPGDSSRYVTVFHATKLKYKPSLLAEALFLKSSEIYKKSNEEKTYKKLSSLGIFKTTNINYVNGANNTLTPILFSQPAKSQSFTVSTDGKHFSGLYGITGSLMYTHNNLFGGGERLSISMSGGLEMQRLLFQSDSNSTLIGDLPRIYNTFNTAEFGPRILLTFPRFVFLPRYSKRFTSARTELSASVNYQRRPDFTRGIEEFSFGWIWNETPKITHRFNPVILSAIAISKSDEFQQRIDQLNDRFLAASYSDHIIAGSKYSFTYLGKDLKKRHSNDFIGTIETAGNLLRTVYDVAGRPLDDELTNSYNLFNIRFAQFAKISVDYRHTFRVSRDLRKRIFIVYRAAGGIGVPLTNLSEALPFEKSFFAGGANGMRAWKVRTLGPGSYLDPNARFDKIGDIQLEGNFEIRFPLINKIDGAFFVDAGNIWLINEDSLRVGGKFQKETFIGEIAVGSGVGIRIDIDFFIIRLDFAVPIKHPALPVGSRWIYQGGLSEERRGFFSPQFNLGIGLPF